MALTQRLEMRQSHALVMTPQLMQAIKLLELSNLELTTYVENELERNPLLEQAGEPGGAAAEPASDTPTEGAPSGWDNGNPSGEGKLERPIAGLDDIPPADANAAASRSNGERHTALFRMGRSWSGWPRRRGLQPRSLRRGRDQAF